MTLVKKIKDKKVNFEFNKEFIKVVTDKIVSNDAQFITNSFKEMHPADAADIIEHLNQNDRESLIKLNNFKIDPEVFVELNESIQSEIIKHLSADAIVNILKNLESDDAIKILENVDEKYKNIILSSLPPKDRFALLESLSYPEDSAARIMQREFTAIPSNWSVGQTIDYLRENKELPDEFLEIFIVDEEFKPKIGFTRRTGVRHYGTQLSIRPRTEKISWLRKYHLSYYNSLYTTLANQMESQKHSFYIPYLDFESGYSFSFEIEREFDRPDQDFTVSGGGKVPAGEYWWTDYNFDVDLPDAGLINGGFGYVIGHWYHGEKNTIYARVGFDPFIFRPGGQHQLHGSSGSAIARGGRAGQRDLP